MSIDNLTLRLGARWHCWYCRRTLAVAAGFMPCCCLSWGGTFLCQPFWRCRFSGVVLAGLRFCWPVPCLFAVLAVARAGGARLGWQLMPGWR